MEQRNGVGSRLVLDVSSPITRRVYNLGLDEFIEWYGQEARPGFTKTAVNAWPITLAGLGSLFRSHGLAGTDHR